MQPPNRYWSFQAWEAGIFVVLALAAGVLAFWWVRRKSPPAVAFTQLAFGRMLLARQGEGDAERAQGLLQKAAATAESLGMAGVLADTQSLLAG